MREPVVAIETITPKQAQVILAHNDRNRSLASSRVTVYSGAMLAGEWRMNGETIKFNGDGTLLDGQHRLAAVVRSGQPQQSSSFAASPPRVRRRSTPGGLAPSRTS
jgi:hypothetical protein